MFAEQILTFVLTQEMKKITKGCFHTVAKQVSTVLLFAANLCVNQPWPHTFLYEAKHDIYRYTACIFPEINAFFLKQLSYLLSS